MLMIYGVIHSDVYFLSTLFIHHMYRTIKQSTFNTAKKKELEKIQSKGNYEVTKIVFLLTVTLAMHKGKVGKRRHCYQWLS